MSRLARPRRWLGHIQSGPVARRVHCLVGSAIAFAIRVSGDCQGHFSPRGRPRSALELPINVRAKKPSAAAASVPAL